MKFSRRRNRSLKHDVLLSLGDNETGSMPLQINEVDQLADAMKPDVSATARLRSVHRLKPCYVIDAKQSCNDCESRSTPQWFDDPVETGVLLGEAVQ